MRRTPNPLFVMLASLAQQELSRQVAYLEKENEILRARLPKNIRTTKSERVQPPNLTIPDVLLTPRSPRSLSLLHQLRAVLFFIARRIAHARTGKPSANAIELAGKRFTSG